MSGSALVPAGPAGSVVRANVIDRAIEFFSPRLGAERMRMRLGMDFARQVFGPPGQYIGARRDRRPTQGWNPRAGSGNSDTLGDLDGTSGLRSRSRDLERNEPIAAGAINANATAVLGPGLIPWPHIDREALGMDDDDPAADAWENQALRLYRAHLGTTAIDFGCHDNIDELSEIAFRGELLNGDILAVRRYVERPNRLFGLAVQLIEADRVCNPFGMPAVNIIGGVEIDPANGETVAYHVASRHPGDNLWWSTQPLTWARIPKFAADGSLQAQLIMRRGRPEIMRGVPYLACVIEPLRKLGIWSSAELTAAVLSSFFTVFVKRKTTLDGDQAGDLFNPNVQSGPAGANPRNPNRNIDLGEGAIVDLDDNEDISIANPARPNAQFDPFFLAMLRQIGIALEIPYEVLILHFSSSYSASRAALLQAWRMYMTRRARFIRMWYTPVWEWFITEAVARGYLNAPGFFDDPLIRASYCGVNWSGPTMPQVDEMKAATAAGKRLELTLTTYEEETANMTGTSWARKFGQVKKERRMLAEAGIPAAQDTLTTRETEPLPPPPPAEDL